MEGLKAYALGFLISMLSVIATICLIAFPLQIAMIVIGAKYKDECPVEDMIPIYLIVAGSVGLLSNCCSFRFTYTRKNWSLNGLEEEEVAIPLQSFMLLFLFPWFIAGNVWIYKNYEPDYTDPNSPDYCNKTLYLFAFWVTNSYYIIFGVGFISMFLMCMRAVSQDQD